MTTDLSTWEASAFIDSAEAETEFLIAASAEHSYRCLAEAILEVATARGMSDLARQARMRREDLYALVTRTGSPDPAVLVDLVIRLGVPPERLAPEPGHKAAG